LRIDGIENYSLRRDRAAMSTQACVRPYRDGIEAVDKPIGGDETANIAVPACAAVLGEQTHSHAADAPAECPVLLAALAMASSMRHSTSRTAGASAWGCVRLSPTCAAPNTMAPRGRRSSPPVDGGRSGGGVPPARCHRSKKYC
jgi:hypothetical protein